MKKLLISLLAVTLIAACSKSEEEKAEKAKAEQEQTVACAQQENPLPRQIKLDPEQYKPYEGEGEAEIFGRLCIDVNGAEKCLANQMVVLNPVTDYSTEWFARHWSKNENLAAADPIAQKINRTIQTDQDGNFSFKGLVPGTYYVGAVACPCVAKQQDPDLDFKFQRLGAKVTVVTKSEADLRKVFE